MRGLDAAGSGLTRTTAWGLCLQLLFATTCGALNAVVPWNPPDRLFAVFLFALGPILVPLWLLASVACVVGLMRRARWWQAAALAAAVPAAWVATAFMMLGGGGTCVRLALAVPLCLARGELAGARPVAFDWGSFPTMPAGGFHRTLVCDPAHAPGPAGTYAFIPGHPDDHRTVRHLVGGFFLVTRDE